VRQASALYGVQAGVLHKDGKLRSTGACEGAVYSYQMCAGGRVQTSTRAGMCSGARVLCGPEGLRAGRLLQLVSNVLAE
jgi:hypothetical protein